MCFHVLTYDVLKYMRVLAGQSGRVREKCIRAWRGKRSIIFIDCVQLFFDFLFMDIVRA